MEQNYIEKEISGIKESNLDKLKSIFPSIIKDGQVDFEELKNMLGEFEQVEKEKYEFNWCGKQKAKQTAISGIKGKTLKLIEEDSKNIDITENLYIEGDNLEVLKLLRNNYASKIKMIYIDPPYNTGNDFVYNDSFKMSNEEVNENSGNTINGEKQANINKDEYSKNSKEESKYHSNWLNMMYPRLKLAQELLTEDGVIFISIDDNEQSNLKKLCDDIYGERNFIACLPTIMNLKGNNDEYAFSGTHEYTIVYSKNEKIPVFNNLKIKEKNKISDEWKIDEYGYYKLGTLKGGGENGSRLLRPNLYYPIYVSDNCEFKFEKNEEFKYELLPISNDMEMTWRWSKEKLINEKHNILIEKKGTNFSISRKIRPVNNVPSVKPKTLFYKENYSSGNGVKIIKELFENRRIFNYSKPLALLSDFFEIITDNKEHIILDFFSGSATTAHACMKLNSEDGGNRKYIMVQLPEICDEKSEAYKAGYKNICEIGKERIRRAGEQIKEELIKAGETEKAENLDIGFKVLRLDETNINWEKEDNKININKLILDKRLTESQTLEALNDFTPDAKDIDIVYELMLRYYGVSLTEEIDRLTDIGNKTYSVCDTLIVCLEDEITSEMIDKLSSIDFAKIYFRDSGFKGDNALELKENLMTRLQLQRKNKNNITYRVEFI